jgi:hypothetical protein
MSETNNTIATPEHDSSAIAAIAESAGDVSAVADTQASVELAGLASTPILPDGVAVASTQPIALSALILDSVEDLAEGAAPAGQPVEDLVTKTALGGFGPSSAPRREKPPVELHEYDSPFFRITARRAVTNNTIDFIFTRKSGVAFPVMNSETEDDLTLSAWLIESYAMEKYVEAVKELPTAPHLSSLDYSLVFNLKPVQTAEKIIRDLGGNKVPEGDEAMVYAFILMSPNVTHVSDDVPVIGTVPRSIRINEHVGTMVFYSVAMMVKEAFNRGEIGTEPPQATDGDLTMEKIRRQYLKITGDANAPAKPTQTKKEVKAERAAKVTGAPAPQAPADVSSKTDVDNVVRQPRERAERPERDQRDQREGGTHGRASDRLLHRHIEASSSRHDELMAQLRINQKQQGQILEGQKAILDSNETLFSVMNLVIKALGK